MVAPLDQADLVSEVPHLRAIYQFVKIQDRLDRRAIQDEFDKGQLVADQTDRGHATWKYQSHEELQSEGTEHTADRHDVTESF